MDVWFEHRTLRAGKRIYLLKPAHLWTGMPVENVSSLLTGTAISMPKGPI